MRMFPWDSAIYRPQVRFDTRAEREEYERLFTIPRGFSKIECCGAAGQIELESRMSRSGRRCTKNKRRSADYFLRQGSWVGAKRSDITLPTNSPSESHPHEVS